MIFLIISGKNLGRNIFSCSGLILLQLLLATFPCSQAGAQGVAVSPSRIFYNLSEGGSSTERIKISNTDSSELILNASLKDWYRDSLGNKIYFAPGSLNHSNANWLRISPSQIVLKPGESKEVSINIEVPQDAPPVSNSMLFLTQVNKKPPQERTDPSGKKVAVLIKLEIGIHVYNTLPAYHKKNIQFTQVEERAPLNDSTRVIATVLKNTGEVSTDAFLRLELTHKISGENRKFPARAITMLPGATQVILHYIPAHLAAGTYLAAFILDYGEDAELKVAQKDIQYE